MRIMTFNANGIRSAISKGFLPWFAAQNIDVLCLQETKAHREQLDEVESFPAGYHCHLRSPTLKKGYSGVAIFSRSEPDAVIDSLDWPESDDEGRYIEARFGNTSVVSLYLPSGSSGDERQQFKFRYMERFESILATWAANGRDYVICGDWNIVHTERDIRNWKSNQKNSGCLPEERAWLGTLFERQGWVDSYRHLNPEGEDYTWWSQRGQARKNNVGWRIDYQMVTPGLKQRLKSCSIHPEPRFSDHAPFAVEYA